MDLHSPSSKFLYIYMVSVCLFPIGVFFPALATLLSSHQPSSAYLSFLLSSSLIFCPLLCLAMMADHQRIGGASPNMPLTPSTVSSPQSSNRGQEESFAPLHAVILSLITTVGGYLQSQFQSKNLSLFDEHGKIMRAVFMMLFLYVMGLMAELKLQNRSNYPAIMKQFTALIGLLVVVLLLFILSLFLGLAASIIWALLAVGPTVRFFGEIIQWLRGILHICTNQTAASNFDMEESVSTGIQENRSPV